MTVQPLARISDAKKQSLAGRDLPDPLTIRPTIVICCLNGRYCGLIRVNDQEPALSDLFLMKFNHHDPTPTVPNRE